MFVDSSYRRDDNGVPLSLLRFNINHLLILLALTDKKIHEPIPYRGKRNNIQ